MLTFNPTKTLDQLLYKRFDYAGMFPPAALTFEAALTEGAAHATSLVRPWLIGTDLVLDTPHVRLLASCDPQTFGFTSPPSVAMLVTEGATAAIQASKDLSQAGAGLQPRVVAFEVKVSVSTLPTLVKELGSHVRATGALIAVEPDLSTPDWRELLRETVTAITKSPLSPQLALKCRCTGPTGIGPERLAGAIAAAADAGIGFKVTGGLHHPIVEPQVHNFPMGFLNVTYAVYMRRTLGSTFSEQSMVSLLTNTRMEALSFADGIRYEHYEISRDQLAQAQLLPFSIGSCSIQEPDQDLVRLGA
jgi:hypothetical protein